MKSWARVPASGVASLVALGINGAPRLSFAALQTARENSVIEVDKLYKYYGTARAVGPLSVKIDHGEVVGLLGLNGAGKTTTLRVLACDLLPSSGSVRVGGFDVVDNPDQVRRLVGYLPDTPPLYDEMTVARYLAFVARLRGLKPSETREAVLRAGELAGLDKRLADPIGSLSHGYRQRVGIAQAIVHKPKLVVLDEPSSGLDPVQIKDMRRLVRSLGGEHTVIVSSHNLPEISEMCDRLLVMGQGTIVASGSEAELVARWARTESIRLTLVLPEGTTVDDAAHMLSHFEGVRDIEAMRAGESAERSVSFALETTADVRAALARAIIERGWDLLTLGRGERELENVFSKLAFGTADATNTEAA
jgi:ABC-2 type transport system ATP-binding protein